MKKMMLAATAALFLTACTQAQLAAPVPVAVVQNSQTALASYQAALGLAQVALRGNPQLLARVNEVAAKAAPYVAAAELGVNEAGAATSLSLFAAQMLIEAAPYIVAVPRK